MRITTKMFLLALAAALTWIFSIHSGTVAISFAEIFTYFAGGEVLKTHGFLIDALRIPRTEAAFFVGGTLGATGLVLQTLLRNPLAEPYTLGLAGGSSLGAITALYFSLEPSTVWIPAFSTIGCLIAAITVLSLGQKKLQFESRSLILFGVMLSLFFGALVVSGLSILSPQNLQTALFWLLGQFGTSRDIWIRTFLPFMLFGLSGIYSRSRALDALNLGESRSLSLGYSPKRERLILILFCTILTAISVSLSGLVGFIGLVSPHLARKFMKTSYHRALLIGSFLIGSTLLTLADSFARILARGTEIPAGSIAAILGAPVLMFLLKEHRYASVD